MMPSVSPPDRQRSLWLLRTHLLLAGGTIVLGSALSMIQTGTLPLGTLDLSHLPAALGTGDGAAWVSAGFLLLILTPVLRLLTSAGTFVRERDWPYVAMTGLVLAIIVAGMVLGGR
jgi:uncharacterized membrane protein